MAEVTVTPPTPHPFPTSLPPRFLTSVCLCLSLQAGWNQNQNDPTLIRNKQLCPMCRDVKMVGEGMAGVGMGIPRAQHYAFRTKAQQRDQDGAWQEGPQMGSCHPGSSIT